MLVRKLQTREKKIEVMHKRVNDMSEQMLQDSKKNTAAMKRSLEGSFAAVALHVFLPHTPGLRSGVSLLQIKNRMS